MEVSIVGGKYWCWSGSVVCKHLTLCDYSGGGGEGGVSNGT